MNKENINNRNFMKQISVTSLNKTQINKSTKASKTDFSQIQNRRSSILKERKLNKSEKKIKFSNVIKKFFIIIRNYLQNQNQIKPNLKKVYQVIFLFFNLSYKYNEFNKFSKSCFN